MKKYSPLAIALAALISAPVSTTALAAEGGSCHFHGNKPATETVVLDCANKRKDALLSNGKLEPTWQAVKHDKAEIVEGKNGKEWKVTYKNTSAKDKDQQSLFMFFTLPGNFVAANFTGK
jgi:Family of unknown function (DUF6488)